jgi:hypothetical protein
MRALMKINNLIAMNMGGLSSKTKKKVTDHVIKVTKGLGAALMDSNFDAYKNIFAQNLHQCQYPMQ